MKTYKPLMSQKEIERRKIWQEKVYSNLKNITKKRKVRIAGKNLLILPGMFAPFWGDSILLANMVKKETRKGDTVLDLGTGTGIQGVFAANKASLVILSDINPKAIKCAKLNIKSLRLENKIKVLKSDLFSNIKSKFDLIIFNPPFRWFKPRDILERGELDENYKTLNKFFKEVRMHLNKSGKILLVFSDTGDLKYLQYLIKKNKFKSKIIGTQKKDNWKYVVYKLI